MRGLTPSFRNVIVLSLLVLVFAGKAQACYQEESFESFGITHPANQLVLCPGTQCDLSAQAQWKWHTDDQWISDTTATYLWYINDIYHATGQNVTWTAPSTPGTYTIKCVATGVGGSAVATVVVIVSNTITITTQPISQIVTPGVSVTFAVVASGPALSYQWQVSNNGGSTFSNIGGATDSTYTTITAGAYRCAISSSCAPTVISSVAVLSVSTVINSQPIPKTVCPGETATFQVVASGPLTGYQWQVCNASGTTTITGATNGSYSFTAQAADNGNKYQCLVTGLFGTTISSAATLTVTTAPVISAQPLSQTLCDGGTATFLVSASGQNLSYQWQSSSDGVNFAPKAGATDQCYATGTAGTYNCVITGPCNQSVTSAAATLTINTPPAITTQPTSQSITGGTATFTVAATGSGLTYQWQSSSDGGLSFSPISGETNPTFTTGTAGTYNCAVSGICSRITSATVTLIVSSGTQAPLITDQNELDELNFFLTLFGYN